SAPFPLPLPRCPKTPTKLWACSTMQSSLSQITPPRMRLSPGAMNNAICAAVYTKSRGPLLFDTPARRSQPIVTTRPSSPLPGLLSQLPTEIMMPHSQRLTDHVHYRVRLHWRSVSARLFAHGGVTKPSQ